MAEKKKEKKEKKGGSKLLIILLILTTLIVIGVAAYFLFYAKASNTNSKTQAAVNEKTVALNEFIVNLNDQDQSRYLKIDIDLAYTDSKVAQNINDRMPEIRDIIIKTLRQKSSADFSNNNLNKVISELITNVNSVLTNGQITNIYITDFLIQ